MAVKIVPHGEDKKDLVEGFNQAMRDGGSKWGFYVDPVPRWIPKEDSSKVHREFWLALENDERCVGAYALKPQAWRIRGAEHVVADWQGPISLGAVDNRYAALGLRLVRDMLKKQPLLYSWGHGGDDEPIMQMLTKMGWLMHRTPFLFRICNPKNFFTKNAYLREDPKKAIAQDVLALSGLGTIGVHLLHAALRVKSLKSFRAKAEVVPRFEPWADAVWDRVKERYQAIAVRDAATMNALVPEEQQHTEWPPPTRLRVSRDGDVLGWAVVLERQEEGDQRFGDMRMGMIADCLADPKDAGAVVWAAFDYLREVGVDMVMANQSHPGWVAGFEQAGFFKVDDRRTFCASPKLEEALRPWDEVQAGLFLSNFDGHGPMGI